MCLLVLFLAETPTLARDKPYGAHQVSWRSGDAEISGTLLTPEGDGPHPAVVFVHGSGPATRASLMTQPGIRGKGLAERFAERGIAVLVYDKRGSGESTGNAAYTFEQLDVESSGDLLGGGFAYDEVHHLPLPPCQAVGGRLEPRRWIGAKLR